MNRRNLLKSISMLSAATLIPRSIFAVDKSVVDDTTTIQGPCIIFKGLWGFWISESGVKAFTPQLQSHKIRALRWPSKKGAELSGVKFSIEIGNRVVSSTVPKLVATNLAKDVHDRKLSAVLPAKNAYPNDPNGRTFSLNSQAACITIDLPLPASIAQLQYMRIDPHQPLFVKGGDEDLLGGTNKVHLRGFPNVQAFVYSGSVATVLDEQRRPILAASGRENLHLATDQPAGSDEAHMIKAFQALTHLLQKKQPHASTAGAAQTLELTVSPGGFMNQVLVCGELPLGIEPGEVVVGPEVSEKQDPETHCAVGSGIMLGDII
jgi:hypothetical protein